MKRSKRSNGGTAVPVLLFLAVAGYVLCGFLFPGEVLA